MVVPLRAARLPHTSVQPAQGPAAVPLVTAQDQHYNTAALRAAKQPLCSGRQLSCFEICSSSRGPEVNSCPSMLQDRTRQFMKNMAAEREDLDALFAQLDAAASESRLLFAALEGLSSNPAPAAAAAVAANAASQAPSAQNAALQAAQAALPVEADSLSGSGGLQVPAYVHMGSPLIVEEPVDAAEVGTLCCPADGRQDIDW